jgi:ribonucleotide reductase beta subunit family protein with ferritin-like domain
MLFAHLFRLTHSYDETIGTYQECDQQIEGLSQEALRAFWIPSEVRVTAKDTEDYMSMTGDGRRVVRIILEFFGVADSWITHNLATSLTPPGIPDADRFMALQTAIENVHQEVYRDLLKAIPDGSNKIDDVIKHDGIKEMREFLLAVDDYPSKLLAAACFEGIFFTGSFAYIYWLATQRLMPGLVQANELIGRDEHLHAKFACTLYSKLVMPLPVEVAHSIISRAVNIADTFTNYLLRVDQVGMTAAKMRQYNRLCANIICSMAGIPKIYEVVQPFAFMEQQNMDNRTDFFVRRPTEYARPIQSAELNPMDLVDF